MRVIDTETGQVVDDADPSAGLVSGKYDFVANEQAHIVDPEGRILAVDPQTGLADLQQTAAGNTPGYRFATAEEIAKVQQHTATHNTLDPTQPLRDAAAFGVARGLTGGLSDWAFSKVDPSVAQGIRALQEVHPTISAAGEVAGTVGGVVTGEAAAALAAARLAPLAARAGGTVASVARAVQGAGKVTRAASRVVASSLEGSAYELGHAVSEDALGIAPLTADRAVAALGHGALYGLAGGVVGEAVSAGVPALARALRRAAPEATEAAATRTAVELTDEMAAEASALKTAKRQGWLHGRPVRDALEEFARDPVMREAITRPRMVDDLAEQFTKAGDDVADDVKLLLKARGTRKAEYVRAALADTPDHMPVPSGAMDELGQPVMTAAKKAQPWIDSAREMVDNINVASQGLGGGTAEVKRIRAIIDGFDAKAGELSAADQFLMLDELKGLLDGSAKKLQKQGAYNPAADAASNIVLDYTARLRGALEDDMAWGSAAVMQREINQSSSLAAQAREQIERGALKTTRIGFDRVTRMKPQFALKLMNDPESFISKKNAEGLLGYLEAQYKSWEVGRNFLNYGEAEHAALDRMGKRIKEMRDLLGVAERRQHAFRRAQDIADASGGGVIGRLVQAGGASAGAKVGGLFAGPLGAAAGAAVGQGAVQRAISKPLDQILKHFDGTTVRGGWKNGLLKMAAAVELTKERSADAAREFVEKALTSGTVRRAAKAGTIVAASKFTERAAEVLEAGETRSSMAVSGAPNLSGMVAETAARGVEYLRAALPPAALPSPWNPSVVRKAAESDMIRWLRKADAVQNPLGALTAFGKGAANRDQMACIEAVYPELYASVVDNVRAELAHAGEQGRTLSATALDRIYAYFPGLNPMPPTAPTQPMPPAPVPRPEGRPMKLTTKLETLDQRLAK